MTLLADCLEAAVPLHIWVMKDWSPEARMWTGRDMADYISAHGDVILYRGHKQGESGRAFNALAKGLAAAAYQPGGVTFHGLHWCAAHMRERWPDGERICPACLREERKEAGL